MNEVLLETVHGSHLYGLAHAASDLDVYRVVNTSSRRPRQVLSGKDDFLTVPLSTFLIQADEGVPQALEAMFSPVATGPFAEYYARHYRMNIPNARVTYKRTIGNFARLGVDDEAARALLTKDSALLTERERESVKAKKPRRVERNGMLKYRRHALRLLTNLEEAVVARRFNPTLSGEARENVLRVAELPDGAYAAAVRTRLDLL